MSNSARTGRPRDRAVDEAIIETTRRLILSEGYAAITVERVAREAGTTRPAVYRRYRGRGELLLALLVERFGVDPAPDTGTLEGDLHALQLIQVQFFDDEVVRAAAPGLLGDLSNDPELGQVFHERFIAPRRHSVAQMLKRAKARGETTGSIDPATISDLLTGPLLLHVALPSLGTFDKRLVDATVRSALANLSESPKPAPRGRSSVATA